jgi:hypothetical protein
VIFVQTTGQISFLDLLLRVKTIPNIVPGSMWHVVTNWQECKTGIQLNLPHQEGYIPEDPQKYNTGSVF